MKNNSRIKIKTEYIKLDALLKYAAVCPSGGTAGREILEGRVYVNGVLCLTRGKKIYPGDSVSYLDTNIIVE